MLRACTIMVQYDVEKRRGEMGMDGEGGWDGDAGWLGWKDTPYPPNR